MSDEEAALLQAVLDRPKDDAPRLVYADWLEETREPLRVARAELIRVQIALERMPETDSSWPQLAKREQRLLRQHWKEWQRPFRNQKLEYIRRVHHPGSNWRWTLGRISVQYRSCWWFGRGFIEEVEGVLRGARLATHRDSPVDGFFAELTGKRQEPQGSFELEAAFPLRRAIFCVFNARPTLTVLLEALRQNPRLDQLEWLQFYAPPLVMNTYTRQAAPLDFAPAAVEAGFVVYELRLPWFPIGLINKLLRVVRPRLFDRGPPSAEELDRRIWWFNRSGFGGVTAEQLACAAHALATPGCRRVLAQMPTWKHTRPEIVRRWYGIFLGDLLRESNAWSVAFSEARTAQYPAVTCYILFKPETAQPAGLERLRAMPYFQEEHR
jgi:uncharacterized protein (TIGR02996 family)